MKTNGITLAINPKHLSTKMFLFLLYPSHRLGNHWSVPFEQMEVIPLPDDIILDDRASTKLPLCGFPKDASYVLFFELTSENSFKK